MIPSFVSRQFLSGQEVMKPIQQQQVRRKDREQLQTPGVAYQHYT